MMQLAVSLVPLPSPPPSPPPSYLPPPPSPNMRAFSSRPPIPARTYRAGGLASSSSSSSSPTTSALYCLGGFAAGMAVSLAARRVRAARRWIATAEDSTYTIHTMLCTQGPPHLSHARPRGASSAWSQLRSLHRFAHSLCVLAHLLTRFASHPCTLAHSLTRSLARSLLRSFHRARRAMCAPRSLSLALLLHSLRPPQSPWPCGGQGTR